MRKPLEKVKPDLVLIGDLHIGDLHPECRSDNYREALARKLTWIQEQWPDVPKVTAGDVFDHWKQSPEMITFAIRYLPRPIVSVRGQHDLPNHSMELADKSAYETLLEAGTIAGEPEFMSLPGTYQMAGFNWGEVMPPSPIVPTLVARCIAVIHVTVWEVPLVPGQAPGQATQYLKAHTGWDLILTGDNHQTFVVRDGSRLLVNPGSLMRMRADQMDHRPSVFLYYANDNRVEQVFVPIADGVISREHIEVQKQHEQRVSSFIARLERGDMEVGMSFIDNMTEYLRVNSATIEPGVRDFVLKCME